MLKNFINNFNKLPKSNKSLVFLMWIYSFGTIIANIFVVIYIYKLNNSFNDLIIYALLNYTFITIGFSFIGFLMAYFRKNIKYMFYLSYISFIIAFSILLFFGETSFGIYLYGIIYGLGLGFYWNGIHTQELVNIQDTNRDLYSSSIYVGKNILRVLSPFLVSAIFFIALYLNIDGYMIIFCILPIFYLISLKYIHNIGDYYPQKISIEDIKNFFNFKKYKFGHLYFFIGGFGMALASVLLPIVSYYILKTEINIGIFEGIFGILSTLLIIFISLKRKNKNRFRYFGIFTALLFLSYIFLAFNINIIGYIIYSLLLIIIGPLFRVSDHIYELSTMDNIKTEKSDFYPAMLFREVILLLGRILSLLLLLFIVNSFDFSDELVLKYGIIVIGFSYLLLIPSIYFWEKFEKSS